MASINTVDALSQTSDNTGVLDVQANNVTGFSVSAGGMYVKSVTTTQRNALVPTTGMLVYDTTTTSMWVYTNSAWQQITGTPILNKRAIFGYGSASGTRVSITNLVSNTGVVSTDTAGVGTARQLLAAASYGNDKAIFGYGTTGAFAAAGVTAVTNLVSNTGVVAADTTGVGTARVALAAASYGTDKAIFGYGYDNASNLSTTNLVANTGVVANNTTGVGSARRAIAATTYGTDKAIFGFGFISAATAITNLVSSTGVVATDTTGVGTGRSFLAAAGYGGDKAIFGYGATDTSLSIRVSMTNLVSNTGVVATDTTGVGTARVILAAAGYGGDKAIFGYGATASDLSMTNLVSNTGVVSADTTGVGTARASLAAATFGS
jgi:hypothetical protein